MIGKLIVCEGLDCSGKTTAIKKVINLNPGYIYSKGIGSNSLVGRTAKKFPSTFMFLFELIFNIYFHIIPNIKKNKIILQDRYDISITSFVPNTNKKYNQLLIKFIKLLIQKPDAIIYFHLPIKERIKRLKQKGKKYELMLAENPDIIVLREKEYEKWYNNLNGSKMKIDTKKNNISQTTKMLERFIQEIKKND